MGMPSVGQIVYRPYKPQKLGKILEVGPDLGRAGFQMVRVAWAGRKGQVEKVEWAKAYHMNYLADLVEDHSKKLAGHIGRLTEMAMWEPDTTGVDVEYEEAPMAVTAAPMRGWLGVGLVSDPAGGAF